MSNSIWHDKLAKFFPNKFELDDIEHEFDTKVNQGLEPITALMLVTTNYLTSEFETYNVPVGAYQRLFREHYTESKFDYSHVLAWAKVVNEFGVEPADANWQAIMPDLPDNQLK